MKIDGLSYIQWLLIEFHNKQKQQLDVFYIKNRS